MAKHRLAKYEKNENSFAGLVRVTAQKKKEHARADGHDKNVTTAEGENMKDDIQRVYAEHVTNRRRIESGDSLLS